MQGAHSRPNTLYLYTAFASLLCSLRSLLTSSACLTAQKPLGSHRFADQKQKVWTLSFESLNNLNPPFPIDPSSGILLTDRAPDYLGVSAATRQFMWGVLGSRLFISLLGLAEARFIDLQAMPQNLAVFLGFSQGVCGGRPRHCGTLCWSTFSDTELLKSLCFIMMVCCVWSFSQVPLYKPKNQSIYCCLWTMLKFHYLLVAHLFSFSFHCFTEIWKKLRSI